METPMYGTVARMRVKPGSEEALWQLSKEMSAQISGLVAEYIYKLDNEPGAYYLVVLFSSKDAYVANAKSPEQHERYLQMREHLLEDPEWHDGEIVSRWPMG